jgi:hypothetical protein
MLEELNFTVDDFKRSTWREIIAGCDKKLCQSFATAFFNAAKQAKEDGKNSLYQVYLLLHAVCGLWLKPEEKSTPFAPIWQGADGSRSVDISDFSESHIVKLKEILPEIDEPELQSRIGDVIWTYQHNGNFLIAEAAVDAYLQTGEELLSSDDYFHGVEHITRAIYLAASLGRDSKKFSEVVRKIEELISTHSPTFQPFIGELLDLLFTYRQGKVYENASIAERYAENYQKTGELHFSRIYWNAAARWHHIEDNIDAELACLVNEAECYVNESESSLNQSGGMRNSIAAHHLQCAIEAFRRIPGTEVRREELHKKMLELQVMSQNELGKISQEVDLTRHVEKALSAIKDNPFQEAFFSLCLISSSPNVKNLRDMIDKMALESHMYSLTTKNIVNEKGRVTGRRNSMLTGTPEEIEAAKQAEMHQWAHQENGAQATVANIARLQLLQEHTPGLRDFLEFTSNNPFVPPGREMIFAKGLLLGFQGNFLESLSLLIPQIENSIRYLLNRQGVVTSSLSPDGIQEEFDLNVLLEMPETVQIFGEDLIFDLKGTFTSRFGANYRNLFAHGLLDFQEFYSYTAVYIWWLLLRICCLPLIIANHQEESKDDTTPNE